MRRIAGILVSSYTVAFRVECTAKTWVDSCLGRFVPHSWRLDFGGSWTAQDPAHLHPGTGSPLRRYYLCETGPWSACTAERRSGTGRSGTQRHHPLDWFRQVHLREPLFWPWSLLHLSAFQPNRDTRPADKSLIGGLYLRVWNALRWTRLGTRIHLRPRAA